MKDTEIISEKLLDLRLIIGTQDFENQTVDIYVGTGDKVVTCELWFDDDGEAIFEYNDSCFFIAYCDNITKREINELNLNKKYRA